MTPPISPRSVTVQIKPRSRAWRTRPLRRQGTSPTQLYRLLDQTNYRKSVDQMLQLLQVLDCDVQPRRASEEHLVCRHRSPSDRRRGSIALSPVTMARIANNGARTPAPREFGQLARRKSPYRSARKSALGLSAAALGVAIRVP